MTLFSSELAGAVARCVRAECEAWPSNCEAGYVAGSRIDGMGNAGSDVDAYVLTDGGAREVEVHRAINGVKLEITFVPRQKLEQSLVAFCSTKLNASGAAKLNLYSALLCHRFLTRVDLFQGSTLAAIADIASRAVLAANLQQYYQGQAAGVFRDAVGGYTVADYDTASLAMPRACSYAIDMYLASCGDTNPLAKWRFKRLGRCEDELAPAITQAFRQIVLPLDLPDIKDERQYVLFAATLYQWLHDLVARKIYCGHEMARCHPTYYKDPLTYVTIIDGVPLLIGRDSGFQITPQFISDWLSVDRLPARAVANFAAGEDIAPGAWANVAGHRRLQSLQAAQVRVLAD